MKPATPSRPVNGSTFLYKAPDGTVTRIPVLVVDGPLCVGYALDGPEIRRDLYWLYIPEKGARIGPYFTSAATAQGAMRKILKHLGTAFFAQPLAWLQRQKEVAAWMNRVIGSMDMLIGGQWSSD